MEYWFDSAKVYPESPPKKEDAPRTATGPVEDKKKKAIT